VVVLGLSSKELQETLGVSKSKFNRWVKEGLPGEKNERGHWVFDEEQVGRWLVERGYAERDESSVAVERELLLRTRAEVAEHFGVGVRSVAQWLNRPGFPGSSGDKFERNGVFPARQIDEWLKHNSLGPYARQSTADDDSNQRLREINIQLKTLELEQRSGVLVDREEVVRFVAQQNAIAKQALGGLPGLLLGLLPQDLPDAVVDDFRRRVDAAITKTFVAMATQFENESDEDEKSKEGGDDV